MRKSITVVAVFVLLAGFILIQCTDKSADPQPVDRELTALEKQLARSGNEFGFKFFKQIVSQEAQKGQSNVFVSPLSVSMALGMTYNGARGETKTAMEECLELQGMTIDEVNESYQSLIGLLQQLDPSVKFEIANSIWYRQGFEVNEGFIDLNQAYFDAEVAELDFDDPASKGIINKWVSEKTNNKIPSIVEQINPLDIMFLINAIYFKGDWTTTFDEEKTKPMEFTRPGGSTVTVDGMRMSDAEMKFLANDEVIGLQMPYGDGDFAMTLLMPVEGLDVDALVAKLDDASWNQWLGEFGEGKHDIVVPKFKLSYKAQLNEVLASLGMEIAFDAMRANFDGIGEDKDLHISRVLHKSFIQVDEKGTEAAAATSVVVGTTSAPQYQWIFNRPFIYIIHATGSNTILFMGKLIEPVWENE